MPRVLHVAQSADYGLGRYLDDLLADQRRRGWPVAFAGPPIDSPVEHHRWDAQRSPGPSVAGEARALARIVRAVDPDVVHLHSSKAGLAGRLVLRGRRPTIFQPHAWSFLAVGGVERRAAVTWERWAARWTHALVCGSEAERALGAARGIVGRWQVVPNAVDVDRFAPGDRAAARRRLGLHDVPTVVCLGRLAVAQKGQDVLLAGWPAVRAAVPDARLVLVGDGPDRAALEAAADDSVAFVGRRHDVADWLLAADVVAQPSRYETLSLSVLEAMACGRSVVAADAVGMAEALGGEAGAVVAVGDPVPLAAAVIARLRDPELAASEGRAGRERAARSHDLAGWGDRMAELTVLVGGSGSF